MSFRVNCANCKTKTTIIYSNEISKDIDGIFAKDLYCQCRNPNCLATSVVRVSHMHYLQPPRGDVVDMAKRIVQQDEART